MAITDSATFTPYLKTDKNYIFLCEHLEPAMEMEQLDRVIEKHNSGMDYRLIAKQERRHPAEIVIALMHQATVSFKSKKRSKVSITRPLARLL